MKISASLILALFSFNGFVFVSNAQPTLSSNSAIIYANAGSVIQVNGGMTLSGASKLDNEGVLTIATNSNPGTFSINGTSVAQGNGTYRVEQDWMNNAVFSANNSDVELYGNMQQFIGGTSKTVFHNLLLTGTGNASSRKKSLLSIDAAIDPAGSLVLNDRELDTDTNSFFVENPNPAAVTNSTWAGTEGFVSSLALGAFSRQTNTASSYLFPTGSSLGTRRYRPVELTPVSSATNIYSVRMANNDATVDLCPITNHSSKIANLNSFFYHKIRHPFGMDNADVTIYYEAGADGNYDGMDQWYTPVSALWNDIPSVVSTVNSVMKQDWSGFNHDQFILANEKEPPVIIPNVFSPDGDGVNDLFAISDANFEEFHIEIHDRWGVKMFESYSASASWDGTSAGGYPATEGTYFFILNAITKKTKTDFSKSGFLMLVRKK